MTSYFFYGVVDGEIKEDTWQALHAHFEKLAREDDVREAEISERQPADEGIRD
jgi:hypothetical protein